MEKLGKVQPSVQRSVTPTPSKAGPHSVATAATPRVPPGSSAAGKRIEQMNVQLLPQGPPRGAAQGQSAEHVVVRLVADLRKSPLDRESAVGSFAAAMKGQPIDADYLKLCLEQMAHLHAEGSVNDGQFESIMTTLVQATGGDMKHIAKEFIQAAQGLPSEAAEGEKVAVPALTLAALRAFGRALSAEPGVANAAANAVADVTGDIHDVAGDLFNAFWDGVAGKASESPVPAGPSGAIPPPTLNAISPMSPEQCKAHEESRQPILASPVAHQPQSPAASGQGGQHLTATSAAERLSDLIAKQTTASSLTELASRAAGIAMLQHPSDTALHDLGESLAKRLIGTLATKDATYSSTQTSETVKALLEPIEGKTEPGDVARLKSVMHTLIDTLEKNGGKELLKSVSGEVREKANQAWRSGNYALQASLNELLSKLPGGPMTAPPLMSKRSAKPSTPSIPAQPAQQPAQGESPVAGSLSVPPAAKPTVDQ